MWKKDNGRRVIVGMSGGVDSAVAAAELLEEGYEVVGLFMKNWEEDDDEAYCSAAVDLKDARSVCDVLGIHLETANFSHEYWDRVFETFLSEYKQGRTPNPDILCNREIKFKQFLNWAVDLGADSIATGHYAQIDLRNGHYQLIKGEDENKDQSYFLYTLGQQALSKSLFPIGHMQKPEVRDRAAAIGLPVDKKKDSTGICFIGERRFRDFLNQFLPAKKGDIRTLEGETIGQHMGAMYFTIGQRGGLGIGGQGDHLSGDSGEPWYVAKKNVEKNVLTVVQGHDHPVLFSKIVIASQLTWVSEETPILPLRCKAKTRYRQTEQACVILALSSDGDHQNTARIEFNEPQRAITPGQSIVFYQGDQCLGGGIIEKGCR